MRVIRGAKPRPRWSGHGCVYGRRRRGSTRASAEDADAVLLETVVRRGQHEGFDAGLREEQAIEGVVVMAR